MWEAIELRELRVFLVLAEELHFGRTADRLRLTPSRVSQSLRELEGKLGAQLMHRTSRRVQLTSFGEQFLRDLDPAYGQLAGVLERARTASGALEGTLRVGLFSGPAGGPHIFEIMRQFKARHPESEVEIVQLTWDHPLGPLRSGDVDLLAYWLPLEEPDLVVGPVLTNEARVLAVPGDHALAKRASVDVEELADHPVPRFDGWPRELRETLFPSRTPAGRPVKGVRIPVGERNLLGIPQRVAQGEFVFPTVESAAAFMGMGQYDLVYVPLTGLAPLRSALVWRRRTRDPKVRAMIRVAKEVLRAAKDEA